MTARFITFEEFTSYFYGKTVAVVGSSPSVLANAPGFIDAHDVVVRVNNYKLSPSAGVRCDVHYSFYGSSIRNRAEDLKRDGVRLCACKCPNAKPIESAWHEAHGKQNGIDFRWIYENRRDWWFCDVFVPSVQAFREEFEALDRHIPTTGFAAIKAVLACQPAKLYLTGFDFFRSGRHNVDERWRPGNPEDPIGHRPEFEAEWLARNETRYPLAFDAKLAAILAKHQAVAA